MTKYKNKYCVESARLEGWDYRWPGAYFITICTHDRAHFLGECREGKMKLSTAGIIAQGCWYEIPRLNPQVTLGAFVVMPNHIHGILILDAVADRTVDSVGSFDSVGTGSPVETFDSNVSTTTPTTTPTNPPTTTPTNAPTNPPTNPPANPPANPPTTTPTTTPTNAPANPPTDTPANPPTNPPTGSDAELGVENDQKNPFFQKISPKSGSVSRILLQYKTACTKHIQSVCPDMNFEWQERFHDHIIRSEQSFNRITHYIQTNAENWERDCFNDDAAPQDTNP